ncbi:MAG: hypothetical protein FJZ38_25105 [Candidatus Rokubacteria bacterium]|nr:hypothetical protein [Candidatus Rokubacteria bacterium]
MLNSGATWEQIGDYFGIAKSTAHERMSGLRHLFSAQHVDTFREQQANILTSARMRVIDTLNRALDEPDAHVKSSPYQLAGTHHWLHSDERLERGQSTQNLSLHELIERVERDRARTRPTTRSAGALMPGSDAAQVPANADLGR